MQNVSLQQNYSSNILSAYITNNSGTAVNFISEYKENYQQNERHYKLVLS
jgi:hypothetical protein